MTDYQTVLFTRGSISSERAYWLAESCKGVPSMASSTHPNMSGMGTSKYFATLKLAISLF